MVWAAVQPALVVAEEPKDDEARSCRVLAETRQGPKSCAVPELAKPVKRPDFEVVDRLVLVEAVNQDRVSRKPLRNAGLGPAVVTT